MHNANLLPLAFTERSAQRRASALWIKATLFAIVLSASIILWGQAQATQSRRSLAQIKAASHTTDSIAAQHSKLQSVMRSLNLYEKKQKELRSAYSPLVPLQLLHQLKNQFGSTLQVQDMQFNNQARAISNDRSKPGELSLQFVAEGTANCSEIMQRIRDTGLFTEVKLSSSLELLDKERNALKFTVRCEF